MTEEYREWFTVKEVAEQRGVSDRAIYKQLKTHADKLKDFIKKEKGKTWINYDGIQILNEASDQSPVPYVEHAEKLKLEELEKEVKELRYKNEILLQGKADAYEALNKIRDKYEDFEKEKAQIEARMNLYLEDTQKKDKEISSLKDEIKASEEQVKQQEEEIKSKNDEISTLQNEVEAKNEEIEKIQNMGFFEYRRYKKKLKTEQQ